MLEQNPNCKDDLIKSLDPHFSKEFQGTYEDIELRLERLFMIKDKWTIREIHCYLVEFCDPEIESKFDTWLSRNTRVIKEANPFDAEVAT